MPSGFASPAQDWFEDRIDLNRHLIKDINSAYIVRVAAHAMDGADISVGDELIVDRALQPKDGSVVISVLEGELIIRRLRVISTAREGSPVPDSSSSDSSTLALVVA